MIRATVICENSVFSNLGALAEHGWSVHVETESGEYLFDTGYGKTLKNNMSYFKKDWAKLSAILLSHHHIDHTGGLMEAVEAVPRKPVTVYAHEEIFHESYLVRAALKPIGIPFSRASLEEKGARFVLNRGFTQIAPDLYLSGEIERTTDFERGDTDIVVKTAGGYSQDPVPDDQSLIAKTPQGLFVILGCSHAGIVNILRHALKMTGESRIHTVIGGTHLWAVSEEQKAKSIAALAKMGIARIGVSHCTGFDVCTRLAQTFGNGFFSCNVGSVVEL